MRTRTPAALRAVLALVALTALTATLTSCGGSDAPSGPAVPGGPAPEFRLASLDGGRVGPGDFDDKVVVVDFWATWCIPCHAQARVLERVHAAVAGDGVQFLAVDVGEDEATVRRFVERNPFPYPVLIDPEDRLSADLGIIALPTLMVIDREGQLVYFNHGVVEEESLRRLLAEAGA
jgi:thiol-disulfide isomerase/thioredoxin